MVESIDAYKVISNMDKGVRYIKNSNLFQMIIKQKKENYDNLTLEDAIERGLKEEAKDLTLKILESHDEHFVLDKV